MTARVAELRALLRGFLPDQDLALASMLRELDHDRGADEFSSVLEEWRDGDESFYRALDRTAGTQDSVFFYDAMLGDFIARCVPEDSADREFFAALTFGKYLIRYVSAIAERFPTCLLPGFRGITLPA